MLACYVCVSTHRQNLDRQVANITRWLRGLGHDPHAVAWFENKL